MAVFGRFARVKPRSETPSLARVRTGVVFASRNPTRADTAEDATIWVNEETGSEFRRVDGVWSLLPGDDDDDGDDDGENAPYYPGFFQMWPIVAMAALLASMFWRR